LTFYSRKELTKNGFLQLALYLYRKKIKLHQFKSKRNYKLRYYDYCKKNELANQSAALRLVLKRNFILKKHLKKSKLKKQLTKLKSFNPIGLSVKHFAIKVQNMRKPAKFCSLAKIRPNRHKNKKYYKKTHLLWKITKNHFMNSQKSKRNYNKKKKKKHWKYKAKSLRFKAKAFIKWQRRKYKKNKLKSRQLNRKRPYAQKLLAVSTKRAGLNKNMLRKKKALSNSKPFENFFNKQRLDLNDKNVSKKKTNKGNKPKWW